MIGGRVVQMLINLFIGIYTARFLGPAHYGLIHYAGAYIGFFSSVCSLGINSVLVKELIEHREEEGIVLGTSLFLKALSSFLSAAVILCVVLVVDAGETLTMGVVALCSIGMVFNVLETFNYWFQSRLESKVTAVVAFIGYAISAAYKVFLIVTHRSVLFFAFASSLDYIAVGLILLAVYRAKGGQRLRFSPRYGRSLLRISEHFIIPSLMVSIYAQTDKFMLKHMIGSEQIGYYSTAVALCSAWCFVLQAIIDSFYPVIAEDYQQRRRAAYEQKNRMLYAIVFYVSILGSLVTCVCARWMVRLCYGAAFLPSVQPMRIISWYTAFSYLGVARNVWVVCEGQQRYLKWLYGASAVLNVALNFALIPSLGASGAAIASLATQVACTMVIPVWIKGLRGNAVMMYEAIALKGVPLFRKGPRAGDDASANDR